MVYGEPRRHSVAAVVQQVLPALGQGLVQVKPGHAPGRAFTHAVFQGNNHCRSVKQVPDAGRNNADDTLVPVLAAEHQGFLPAEVVVGVDLENGLFHGVFLDDPAPVVLRNENPGHINRQIAVIGGEQFNRPSGVPEASGGVELWGDAEYQASYRYVFPGQARDLPEGRNTRPRTLPDKP
ncbi:hypothetical protein ES703_59143 [subsurface metagenome]